MRIWIAAAAPHRIISVCIIVNHEVNGGILHFHRQADSTIELVKTVRLGQGLSFQKWVVVGHWPVTLYNPSIPTARPLICRERHIASIDGGCVLKLDGQLNALLIPDVYRDEMDYVAYDGLPVVVADEDQAASTESINIRWSDSAIEVLREEGDCCWCRHLSTGRELWILKEYIYPRRSDGRLHCEDTTDYLLPVSAGDRLKLVRRSSRGCMVKKDGVTGWYRGRLRE